MKGVIKGQTHYNALPYGIKAAVDEKIRRGLWFRFSQRNGVYTVDIRTAPTCNTIALASASTIAIATAQAVAQCPR